MSEKCSFCGKTLSEEEKDPASHPGILSPICGKCYGKACQEQPDLPWKDPISGEVDYETMEEDLGLDTGDTEDGF